MKGEIDVKKRQNEGRKKSEGMMEWEDREGCVEKEERDPENTGKYEPAKAFAVHITNIA